MSVTATSMVFCFIYHLKGPEVIHIQNYSLTWIPVNTKLCSELDGNKYITFNLYTRKNWVKPQILGIGIDRLLQRSNINFRHPTVIFIHGFTESLYADNSQVLKRSFLQSSDYNVIIVDAEVLLAGLYYVEAVINCRFIGKYVAIFVDYLVSRGMRLSDLHVIGFSLGGQIAGFVGNYIKSGILPRITGLDPAGPVYYFAPPKDRLDPSDAEFVDVIHTSSYLFGYGKPSGHVDFYPNKGGPLQPGCSLAERISGGSLNELVFCEHYRSFRLFAQSLLDPYRYPAVRCASYQALKLGICSDAIEFMGIAVNRTARGIYYIYTGADAASLA